MAQQADSQHILLKQTINTFSCTAICMVWGRKDVGAAEEDMERGMRMKRIAVTT